METFSQRMGIKKVNRVIQINSMDEGLRKSLWNDFVVHVWHSLTTPGKREFGYKIWMYCFNKLIDEIPLGDFDLQLIKSYYFGFEWHEVYDFIEFVANHIYEYAVKDFVEACNVSLKRELSPYRFVRKKLVGVTSDQESAEIEEALTALTPFTPHLERALALLADRKAPDYANSIKESISAVEAICRLITGDPTATLGKALENLEKTHKIDLHHNLKDAFKNLYWYTSDAQGIRHGLVGKPNLDVEDAKFMLIACSAFINYLIAKAEKAGIRLSDK